MEITILADARNPLLRRREIRFSVDHDKGSTPQRLEVRRAVASALKVGADSVFVKRFETKTGMNFAIGEASVYDSLDQAKLVEPEYVLKRNIPPQKPTQETPTVAGSVPTTPAAVKTATEEVKEKTQVVKES